MNKFKGNYVQDWIEDTCEYDFERIRNEKIIKNSSKITDIIISSAIGIVSILIVISVCF